MRDTGLFDQDEDDLAEYETVRQPSGRFRRWVLVLLGVLVVFAMLLAVAGIWVLRKVDPPGEPGAEVSLTVPSGSSTQEIGRLLEENGVISSATIWKYYVRYKSAGPFDAGDYTFREDQSMGDAIEVLEGPADLELTNVTIPEGLTLKEVAGVVEQKLPGASAATFLEAAASGRHRSVYQPPAVNTLEGLLLPETYSLTAKEREEALLQRMLDDLDAAAAGLGYDDAPARVGLSPYETIIVASLVESEAKVDEERGKIARVIYNRLARNINLGIDATIYYALGRRGGGLTRSDLAVDSPYNTRTHAGLPPTPIMVPGRESLAAAINPEPGPWIYYVLVEPTRHLFTDSESEFLRGKAECEREGLGCG